MSKALYLKKYLIEKIGLILTSYNIQLKMQEKHHAKHLSKVDHESVPSELSAAEKEKCKVEVFDIQFAFNNHKLINILKARGTAITNLDFDKIRVYNEEINKLIKNEEEYDNLTKPVCAFITFVKDDGKNIALAYSERETFFSRKSSYTLEKETLFNREPEFIDSTEPTNIIWENRHIKGINYGARVFSAFLIICLMLTITFWVIFAFKQAQIRNQKQWPTVDCQDIEKTYGADTIMHFAGVEWNDMKSSGGKLPMMGALKCQCIKDIGGKATRYLTVYNQ